MFHVSISHKDGTQFKRVNSSISVQIAFAALPYQQDFDIKEYLAAAYRMGQG